MNKSIIKFTGLLLLTLPLLLTTPGCTLFEGGNTAVIKIDIADATDLFIAQGNRASRGDADTLFKITSDGSVKKVIYTKEDNSAASAEEVTPTSITVLNRNFMIIGFININYEEDYYLVNIANGYAYAYTDDIPHNISGDGNYYGGYIEEDKDGNLYFLNTALELIKLTVTDENNIRKEVYSAQKDSVYFFGVDKDGNLGYEGIDSGENHILRYKKNSGGFETLPGSAFHSGTTFWTGFQGELYYYNATAGGTNIKLLKSNPYEALNYGTTDIQVGCGFESLVKIKNKNSIIALGGCTYIYELFNESSEARNIPYSTFSLTSLKFGKASDNFYYIAGTSDASKTVLLKVDPADDSFTYLINGQYDIYKMTVTPEDVITFNALRMSDGAIVIGKINSLGDIIILDETLTGEVTILQRLQ